MSKDKQASDGVSPGLYARTLGRVTRSGRPLWLAILAAVFVGAAVYTLMYKPSQEPAASSDPASPAGLVLPNQGKHTSLAAVGPLTGLDQPCTGWVVAPQKGAVPAAAEEDASSPTASGRPSQAAPKGVAYALTAAQCVGITDSTKVLAGRKLSGVTLGVTAFAPVTSAVKSSLQEVAVTEVVYASARWRNLAVLRLGATYEELQSKGVFPVRLAAQPKPGTTVLAATAPTAGIPEEQQFLRVSKCKVGDVVQVLSGPWVWAGQQSSDCQGVIGGSLGGPVFDPAGDALGMIVGTTIGTTNSDGTCTANRPCQVTANSVSVQSDTTYLQDLAVLGGCLREPNFKLGGKCDLEDPRTVVPAAAEVDAAQPGATVQVTLTGPATGYLASKYGDLTVTDCHDDQGWGQPVPATGWRVRMTLPDKPGWQLACVGSPEQPTPVVVAVDTTPPDTAAVKLDVKQVEAGRMVSPVLNPPEFASFLWTSGPAHVVDCAIAEGYQKYRGTPALIQAADLPAGVCLIAVDSAGNKAMPVMRQVD
jgi:hypothetical protein